MESHKNKYIYIALAALGALLLLYSSYALIKDGSPTVKSLREHLSKANGYHKDSLYDKAIEPYQRALNKDKSSALANYNSGTNLLMKNYKDLKAGTGDPETVAGVYADALAQLQQAASNETDKEMIASARHNEALVHHLTDSLEMAAEAYKESLRKNPADNETRYNLAVVLYQLKNKQDQNQQNQQEQQQEQQQQQNQQPEQNEQQMDKETAEQILQALEQDEQETQEKLQRQQGKKRRVEKEW